MATIRIVPSYTIMMCCIISYLSLADAFSSSPIGTRIQNNKASAASFQQRSRTSLYAFEVVADVNAVAQSTTQAMSSTAAILPANNPSLSAAINSFFQTQPYLAAFLTCSFKASAADIVAQTQEETPTVVEPIKAPPETNDVDLSRNLGFLLYGGLYQGMAQNYLYSVVYPALVGTGEGLEITSIKVLIDNFIFAPFLCLPIAYVFKTAFTSDDALNINTLTQSVDKYFHDVINNGLLVKYWSLWIPVQFLTFGVIPEHFRVAFVAFISFFWICVLSTVVSSNQQQQQQQ